MKIMIHYKPIIENLFLNLKKEKNKNFSILVGVEMNLTVNKNITYENISNILTNGGLGNDIIIISKK